MLQNMPLWFLFFISLTPDQLSPGSLLNAEFCCLSVCILHTPSPSLLLLHPPPPHMRVLIFSTFSRETRPFSVKQFLCICAQERGGGGVWQRKTLTLMIHFHVSNMTWKKKDQNQCTKHYHDHLLP